MHYKEPTPVARVEWRHGTPTKVWNGEHYCNLGTRRLQYNVYNICMVQEWIWWKVSMSNNLALFLVVLTILDIADV